VQRDAEVRSREREKRERERERERRERREDDHLDPVLFDPAEQS